MRGSFGDGHRGEASGGEENARWKKESEPIHDRSGLMLCYVVSMVQNGRCGKELRRRKKTGGAKSSVGQKQNIINNSEWPIIFLHVFGLELKILK